MKRLRKTKPKTRIAGTVFRCVVAVILGIVFFAFPPLEVTSAFTTATTAEEPNRFTTDQLGIRIIENGVVVEGESSAVFGANLKNIQLESTPDSAPLILRVALYPDLKKDAAAGTRAFASQDWGAPTGNQMTLGPVNLVLADGWGTDWLYRDGTFYYRHVLASGEKTPLLLTGVSATGTDSGALDAVDIAVIAEALQAYPAEAPAEWGCVVDSEGNVAMAG